MKIRRGDKILEDQPHNYEDDSEDDSDQVKYLPDNVTKYRYTPTFYFKFRRRVFLFPEGVIFLCNGALIRVADPHSFHPDPDPAF